MDQRQKICNKSNGIFQVGLDVNAAKALLNGKDHVTYDNLNALRDTK